MPSSTTLNTALKEWSATIDALASGDQIFLLRKGGIRETNRHFEINHRRFLLYPTRFHEATRLLKPNFHHLIDSLDYLRDHSVLITAWAEVAEIININDAEQLAVLSELHVWTDEFIAKRVAWKPLHAADLIILKTHKLSEPIRLTIEPHHKGCKSWVDIQPPVDAGASAPVLSNSVWEEKVRDIRALLLDKTAQAVTIT